MRTKRRSEIFKTIRNTSLVALSTLFILILTIQNTQAQIRRDVTRNCNGITVTATGVCCVSYTKPQNDYNGDAGCPKLPWTGIGVTNSSSTEKGSTLVYKFSTPVTSAIISYNVINAGDSGIFTIDGGGILTISEPCNFYVGAGGQSLVGNPVGTRYADGKAKISSTEPFTQITMTSWGYSDWYMGDLEGFILTPVPCQTAPSLSSTTLTNTCPSLTANLNSLHNGTAPSGTTLVWYTTNTISGSEYATPAAATAGTYYAFYYDESNRCYSPASAAVTISSTDCCPKTAPALSSTNISNTCPTTTVNLNSLHTGTIPNGATLVWFTNNAHTGSAYATPTEALAGTYYAFYYDTNSDCYTNATNAVISSSNCCAGNAAPSINSGQTPARQE